MSVRGRTVAKGLVAIVTAPVSETNVSTVISWYATAVDNDSKDDETDHCYDFDHSKHELNYSVS